MTVDIGRIGVWTGVLDLQPTAVAQDAARELESLGYSTLWIPETLGREPFVAAAVLLAGTTTLRLATGIANIYARDPLTTVCAQKTLAEAFPGRFLLGLGVSHWHLVEHLRKHKYDKPLSYIREYLDAMDGSKYTAVPPAEDPGRVLAALGPKMLELSGTRANGAHPYFTTPEHTAEARAILGPGPLLAPEQMVVLETDPATARQTARKNMAVYLRAPNYRNSLLRIGFTEDDFADGGSDRMVDAIVAWGDAETIARRVAAHHDAGADHVCVQALRSDGTLPLDDWRALAPALV